MDFLHKESTWRKWLRDTPTVILLRAAEEKSGIGGSMVRTTRKNATRTGKRTRGTVSSDEPAQVNKAAEAGMAERSAKVASHLTERALFTSERSSRYLLDLSKPAPCEEEPESQQNGFSQAAAWMSEPEWNGESSEEIAETSAGSREPECIHD